jgi:HlyD family secretion protein
MRPSLLLLITVACFSACKDKVEKIKPSIENISSSIYASGLVKSKSQYQAYAAVSGIVNKVFVQEGDTIKKGDAILSISNATQRLNKENAELTATYNDYNANKGKVNEASLMMELALSKMKNDSAQYFRQLSLWQQQIGAKMDLDQKEIAYENAKTAYYSSKVKYIDLKRQLAFTAAQAKKNLQISKQQASDYVLKSQIDGIVYSIDKHIGEIINAQTPVAIIGDARQFVLEMQVDEYDIIKITVGMPVKVTLNSYKGKVFDAKVSRVIPLMNERSKTFVVEAVFTEEPKVLYPNISFEASIVLQTKKDALLIPRQYLIDDSIVLKKDGSKVAVKTGLKDYQKVEILSGITAQDEIIEPKQ